jgi:hypothetical protein
MMWMRAPAMRCRIGVSILSFILPTPKIRAAFMIPITRDSTNTVETGREFIIIYTGKKNVYIL